MELLEPIIERLSKQEARDLKSFVARNSRSEKEIKLIEVLIK